MCADCCAARRSGPCRHDPLGAKIGPMPDLRRITRAQGLHAHTSDRRGGHRRLNALLIVHLDADNRMVRRHFTLLTGWGQPIPIAEPRRLDVSRATSSS